MKSKRNIRIASKVFVGFCVLSLGYVSALSIFDPQATMTLVGVELPNNDAISSIRGIYGGVGLVIVGSLIYLLFKDLQRALVFLILFWGAYAISRILTLLVDGPLGEFGNQWLIIEGFCCAVAVALWLLEKRSRTYATI